MAIYTLNLDLTGADKVEGVLAKLQSASKTMSAPNAFFGGASSGSNSPITHFVDDMRRGRAYSKDIATNLAQGFAPWRSSALDIFKKMNPRMRQSIFANNPDLAAQWNAMINPPGTVKGLRDIGGRDLAKIFALGAFNQGGGIRGLRDIAGSDLAKVAAMGAFSSGSVIKGLREVGGADLAKVHAMGSFEENTKSPSFLQKLSSLPFLARYLTVVGATALAVDVLKKSAEALANVIKTTVTFAHQLYGSSLGSGLSLRYTLGRQAASSVLGVPESEVMRFQQTTFVMQRLQGAIGQISKAAPDLAFVSAQFSILKYDLLGVASSLADKLTPAIDGFIVVLDAFIKSINDLAIAAGEVMKNSLSAKIIGGAIGAELSSSGILSLIQIGITNMSKHGFQNSMALMRQLPASQFERMGLLVGGGGTNPIVSQLKTSNQYLRGIYYHLAGNGALPRSGQFGQLQTMSQP